MMTNLISRATARINSLLKEIQVKQFLAIALVGFLVLTTSPDLGRSKQGVVNKVNDAIHQGDSQRPKTTREWEKEARQTDDSLGARAKEIGKESADAFKDFGKVYPDTAKRSARGAQGND